MSAAIILVLVAIGTMAAHLGGLFVARSRALRRQREEHRKIMEREAEIRSAVAREKRRIIAEEAARLRERATQFELKAAEYRAQADELGRTECVP